MEPSEWEKGVVGKWRGEPGEGWPRASTLLEVAKKQERKPKGWDLDPCMLLPSLNGLLGLQMHSSLLTPPTDRMRHEYMY